MKSRNTGDLITIIERALKLGRFISYEQSWDFIERLREVKNRIDSLLEEGETAKAVELYEMFLGGVYEKAEEIDDSSSSLGMFFDNLFLSWIEARQKAGFTAVQTVQDILQWMSNDDYGFFYKNEKDIAGVLNKEGYALFLKHFQDKFDTAFAPYKEQSSKLIFEYPRNVINTADILKAIFFEKKELRSYLDICEKIPATPADCENIARLYQSEELYADALTWVEKGISLKCERQGPNYYSHGLDHFKQELLVKLGRKDEALDSAWDGYKSHPSEYSYSNLMKYVKTEDCEIWRQKALNEIKNSSLSTIIDICVCAKDWRLLAEKIDSTEDEALEELSHYTTEDAAKGLEKEYSLAAAKIYKALGMRILKSAKSKYYRYAFHHFYKAKTLLEENGEQQKWLDLVDWVRDNHSRKWGFMSGFEEVVSGKAPKKSRGFNPSFKEKAKERWKRQTSKKSNDESDGD